MDGSCSVQDTPQYSLPDITPLMTQFEASYPQSSFMPEPSLGPSGYASTYRYPDASVVNIGPPPIAEILQPASYVPYSTGFQTRTANPFSPAATTPGADLFSSIGQGFTSLFPGAAPVATPPAVVTPIRQSAPPQAVSRGPIQSQPPPQASQAGGIVAAITGGVASLLNPFLQLKLQSAALKVQNPPRQKNVPVGQTNWTGVALVGGGILIAVVLAVALTKRKGPAA